MGAVFQAWHKGLESPVAVKVLILDQPELGPAKWSEFERRFRFEAQVASQIHHEHIARVLDFAIEDYLTYMVMDFIAGADLSEMIRHEAPLAPFRALEVLGQLVAALKKAEEHRIVHRDIKPGNLRLEGYVPHGSIRLKVLDFGLAKQLGETGEHRTATGTIMGTCAYMAPEQINLKEVNRAYAERAGNRAVEQLAQIDCRADLYAAGIVLYEMLAGTRPFAGTQVELLSAHLHAPPPELPPSVPGPVRELTMRLLRKHPAERYAGAAPLEAAIGQCVADLKGMPPAISSRTPDRRGFTALLLFCGVGLTGGLGGVSWLVHAMFVSPPGPQPPRQPAAAPDLGAVPEPEPDLSIPAVDAAVDEGVHEYGGTGDLRPTRRRPPVHKAVVQEKREIWCTKTGPEGAPHLYHGADCVSSNIAGDQDVGKP